MSYSPFEVSRAIANNIGSGFKEAKDESAIERILSQASASGNPDELHGAIGKILSQVSPERQPAAISYLQNQYQRVQEKQKLRREQRAAASVGVNSDLPAALQTEQYKANQKNARLNSVFGVPGAANQNAQAPSVNAESNPQVQPTAQTPSSVPQQEKQVQSPLRQKSDDEIVMLTGHPDKEISEPAKAEQKRRQEDRKLDLEKQKYNEQQIDKSYDLHKDFIDETTQSYRGFETDMKPRLLQLQAIPDDQLVGPTAAKFLETLGIPLGALENPSSELYNKVSQDLLKGLPETYGNRILKVEVDNFLKTIPTLLNSADGRRMIASNMLKLGQMKEVYYKEMRKQQSDLIDKNSKFPKDFQQRVFDNVKPQIDKINNQFIQLSQVKSVPKGTIPYFNPQGSVSFVDNNPEAIKWAEQNGGERIW